MTRKPRVNSDLHTSLADLGDLEKEPKKEDKPAVEVKKEEPKKEEPKKEEPKKEEPKKEEVPAKTETASKDEPKKA